MKIKGHGMNAKKYSGKFITFEGAEGSGKSTQIKKVCRYLKDLKLPVLLLREPGGVKISEKIRNLLLDVRNEEMNDICETLLYMAARAQVVAEVVLPALMDGKIILCDRFLDSTLVYQGYGNGIDLDFIRSIGTHATQSIKPDMTIFFDIDPADGFARLHRPKDRIEQRSIEYHNRVRKGYLELARQEPGRIKMVDGQEKISKVFKDVKEYITPLLGITVDAS